MSLSAQNINAGLSRWRFHNGEGVLDERFRALVDGLHPKFELLVGMTPHAGVPPPTNMPVSGVYLFSDGEQPLYVGRSNRLRERFFLHTREGSRHNQASFAFRLVAQALNLPRASYTREGSRMMAASTQEFIREFSLAKRRIRSMNYRYVEETDQTRQALLEIYAAVVLQTPYNHFGTH